MLPLSVENYLKCDFEGRVKFDELLSKHTTLRVGGICDAWVEPYDIEQLLTLIHHLISKEVRFMFLGKGANVLFANPCYEGVIIHLSSEKFSNINRIENIVEVEAGISLSKFIKYCIHEGLSGLELLSGIPASLGGAIKMNAGAFNCSISDTILELTIIDDQGVLNTIPKSKCGFSYRSCQILQHAMVLKAKFEFVKEDPEILKQRQIDMEQTRMNVYPKLPSAGCCFKNPPGDYAGKLIDELGLKEYTIGGAKISSEHANFIVNTGNATATDILDLIQLIKKQVFLKNKIKLEEEIVIIGD